MKPSKTLYLTGWKDSSMLEAGFKLNRRDTFSARLALALAMLESVGVYAEFASQPGDSAGNQPREGYCSLDGSE